MKGEAFSGCFGCDVAAPGRIESQIESCACAVVDYFDVVRVAVERECLVVEVGADVVVEFVPTPECISDYFLFSDRHGPRPHLVPHRRGAAGSLGPSPVSFDGQFHRVLRGTPCSAADAGVGRCAGLTAVSDAPAGACSAVFGIRRGPLELSVVSLDDDVVRRVGRECRSRRRGELAGLRPAAGGGQRRYGV